MAKRFIVVVFGLVVFCLVSQAVFVFALDFSKPEGYVNDFAGVLNSETKQTLEQQLAQLEKDSLIEIAVVTVPSLEGTTVEDYAVRLFEEWQIGKKDEDNGILFLIAPNEQKTRIEVGYGLEPVLTDAGAGRLLDNYVLPTFKEGDYNKGISDGVAAIIKVVQGEPVTSADAAGEDGNGVWILLVIVAIFLSYLTSFLARSKRWWPGGVIGAILGLILGIYLASLAFKFLAVIGLGLSGLLFDFILSKNYKERKDKGLPTSWWGSGGGFFGGSGSARGGFGGFGGGSSGGGGASRGW